MLGAYVVPRPMDNQDLQDICQANSPSTSRLSHAPANLPASLSNLFSVTFHPEKVVRNHGMATYRPAHLSEHLFQPPRRAFGSPQRILPQRVHYVWIS